MEAIGFIGLGKMGWPMAGCLARAGHALSVLDTAPGLGERFAAEHGVRAATGGGDLAAGSDVIVTMLPTSAIVRAALEGGVLAGLKAGALVLEMSSGAPAITRELAMAVEGAGGVLVDAPVSGGVARAVTADLAIMAGGPAEAVDRAWPILRRMGSQVMRTGAVGTAHAMKALNNLVSAAGFMIAVEALVIGKTCGLDPAVMVDVLNASTGMNNATQKKLNQFVLSRTYGSGFSLALMVKDLDNALELARQGGAATPLAGLTREMWRSALAMGVGEDHTAAARLCERLAGVEL